MDFSTTREFNQTHLHKRAQERSGISPPLLHVHSSQNATEGVLHKPAQPGTLIANVQTSEYFIEIN